MKLWILIGSSFFFCGCNSAEIRDVAEVVGGIAPAIGEAAVHVANSANPATGLIMAGATLLSALLRNNLKGE